MSKNWVGPGEMEMEMGFQAWSDVAGDRPMPPRHKVALSLRGQAMMLRVEENDETWWRQRIEGGLPDFPYAMAVSWSGHLMGKALKPPGQYVSLVATEEGKHLWAAAGHTGNLLAEAIKEVIALGATPLATGMGPGSPPLHSVCVVVQGDPQRPSPWTSTIFSKMEYGRDRVTEWSCTSSSVPIVEGAPTNTGYDWVVASQSLEAMAETISALSCGHTLRPLRPQWLAAAKRYKWMSGLASRELSWRALSSHGLHLPGPGHKLTPVKTHTGPVFYFISTSHFISALTPTPKPARPTRGFQGTRAAASGGKK